ncbi:hypothetical protein E2C01_089743 [Portunus trituberculatus]|uniref:Uncharacterized protein n=1 Tax=Portunus trituberculatus TaxID=210409 RepID=A0A5B7JIB0_PORTR|nr:hypothetical protein [Portunus trituberculatus]
MINFTPWTWTWASNTFLDESRAPGKIATYTCLDNYVEGVSRPEAERTTSGTATCNDGTPPAWSIIPEVPCQCEYLPACIVQALNSEHLIPVCIYAFILSISSASRR